MGVSILEYGNPDEQSEQDLAVQIGNELNKHYPNHPWIVAFQGRALIIRHMAIAHKMFLEIGRDGFGAVLPQGLRTHKEIVKAAIEFGGMLLENFGLPRGPWDGREPIVPKRYRYKQDGSYT